MGEAKRRSKSRLIEAAKSIGVQTAGGKDTGTLGRQIGGNAVWADGIFHRVFDNNGTMVIVGGRMSLGVSEPQRIEQAGYSGHLVVVDIVGTPEIFTCNNDPV